MKKCECELCKFENPKLTATAIVIKDQKLLVAKRNEEPFKGDWDFLGGYMQKGESPEDALKREIKEELGTDCKVTFLGAFPGTANYKEYGFPVLSFAYLTELKGEIKLNKKENSEVSWVPISKLKKIAFDSNMDILKFVKEKFIYDMDRVKKLVGQLDPSASVNEQSLYKAMMDGYVCKIEEKGELLGMGWIFPRQTMLRNQAVVEDMIVDESQRGKGLGEKILRNLIAWAKNEGVEVVELTTNPKRVAANSLYQKVGFKLHPTNHYLLNLK
jgi:8-oxo-dGTP pyrophosphatase MutT (NUDIX family)/predicted GNAT family N-acyltransferase